MKTVFYWFCPTCDKKIVQEEICIAQHMKKVDKIEFEQHGSANLGCARTELEQHEKDRHGGKPVGYFGLKNV